MDDSVELLFNYEEHVPLGKLDREDEAETEINKGNLRRFHFQH